MPTDVSLYAQGTVVGEAHYNNGSPKSSRVNRGRMENSS